MLILFILFVLWSSSSKVILCSIAFFNRSKVIFQIKTFLFVGRMKSWSFFLLFFSFVPFLFSINIECADNWWKIHRFNFNCSCWRRAIEKGAKCGVEWHTWAVSMILCDANTNIMRWTFKRDKSSKNDKTMFNRNSKFKLMSIRIHQFETYARWVSMSTAHATILLRILHTRFALLLVTNCVTEIASL